MISELVEMLPATAAFLSRIGLGTFACIETPERMAWVVLVLRRLDDRPEWFPHGKWATIQHFEQQLHAAADDVAACICVAPTEAKR